MSRNLMIEAGAGTGKTTRLVKAVLEALFVRQIPLDHMVALTFTNKAAGELKERVGLALEEVLESPSLDAIKLKPWWPAPEASSTLEHLQDLARGAQAVLDRADISTIHSFAYSLLKRFPIAAGINPDSEIDDKHLRFDELFREEWPAWLAVELGEKSPRESAWLDLLSRMPLGDIENAARKLADFESPLEKLPLADAGLPARLAPFYEKARALAGAHSAKFNADRLAAACEEVLGAASHGAWDKLENLDPETSEALDKAPGSPKSWTEEDLESLGALGQIARNCVKRGDRAIALLTELLKPFLTTFRARLLSEGCLSHSALLFLSRELVRSRPDIREQLKSTIRLILIDEFQDTDPLQAELLLYLAEKSGQAAGAWKDIQLEPGKLFIVGDPKQSIYRFRGADIAAYQQIGERIISQGGLQETLETNYRSQAQIIDCVNTAFDRLIQSIPEISPPYIAVKSIHSHDPAAWPVQDVELWIATNPGNQSVEEAQETEAEAIGSWIHENVGTLQIPPQSPATGSRPMTYRDIALIFRTYSPMDRFIQALRQRNIPFVVESERFFFSTPEVTDFLNLLRTIANPEDELSRVGFLRGPLAGLTDGEILKYHQEGSLGQAGPMVIWAILAPSTARLAHEPLGDVLQAIFEESFLLELAARSYHGDQTVANVLKLRRLLEDMAAKGNRTMTDLLDRLDEFFEDDTLEGESPLADESYDAVRILTIHKAKGLEFPVVFLPSLHSELRVRDSAQMVFDWRKQTLGLRVEAGLSNLDKLLLDREGRKRDAAEQQRILYVAMTRAKQRLVLSGGIDLKTNRSGTFLNRLADAWGFSLANAAGGKIAIGNTHLNMKRLPPTKDRPDKTLERSDAKLPQIDPQGFAALWKERAEKRKKIEEMSLVMTPTASSTKSPAPRATSLNRPPLPMAYNPSRLGTLIHLFLEHWDFTCEKCSMPALLTRLANTYFAQEALLLRVLPDPKEGKLNLEKDDPMTEVVATVDEAQRLLADFIGSEAWEEIKGSEILGREVPFFYGSPLMRGTIDILYRLPTRQLVIGDYKSGHIRQDYAAQGQAYKEAVKRALAEDAVFKVINLREETTHPSKTSLRNE